MINFKLLLELAIELNREKRNNLNPQIIAALPIYEYLREYGTIKLDIGRQTGKTSTVKAIADEDDLIIIGGGLKSQNVNYRDGQCKATVIAEFPYGLNLAKRYKRIYIEEPSFIHKNTMREMYTHLSKDEFQTFILVGI